MSTTHGQVYSCAVVQLYSVRLRSCALGCIGDARGRVRDIRGLVRHRLLRHHQPHRGGSYSCPFGVGLYDCATKIRLFTCATDCTDDLVQLTAVQLAKDLESVPPAHSLHRLKRMHGLGFGVWGLGFGVWRLGFGGWGLGFGGWGLGFGGLGCGLTSLRES